MDVKRRLGLLLAGTVLGTSILISAPAFADDAQLQQQINAMQRQLQAMQDQLAETKKQAKAAAQQAQQTSRRNKRSKSSKRRISRPTFRRISTPRMCRSRPRGHPRGSTASTCRWPARSSRWKVRSASATKCPRAPAIRPSAPSRCRTRRSTARTSCASAPSRAASRLKASGDIDPARHVKGYFEMDFLGGAPTGELA